ncbi:endoplasmic reticulum resident protein 44 [Drosophila grimshawi]|uniref:GH19278 n=1 Tax=Drosophila grimshawi TaxID=7222 RepID=B4JFA1_DROGR|nr:endoplasmic reticulum resident protein 44 [Drosophila grimshawi]EDV93382.1 GH19278 [Drosophila grimshawi]
MDLKLSCCLGLLLALLQLFADTAGDSIQVDENNVHNIAHSNELVLLLFYTQQCQFSANLLPIFDDAADEFRSLFGDSGKVMLGKVDCHKKMEMARHYKIYKYPTIKVVRHGYVGRQEYRGQRSLKAIKQFVFKELLDPIEKFDSLNELKGLANSKLIVTGYFEHKHHTEYEIYRKAASNLKDYCQFYVKFSKSHVPNSITFRGDLVNTSHMEFLGNLSNYTNVLRWCQQNCYPAVRELTFENAEAITEEGKPLVILFHKKEDIAAPKAFAKVVNEELQAELDNLIFVTGDSETFTHPIRHVHLTEADLPFIAIDCFASIFLFPNYKHLHIPGKFKQFLAAFYRGELHKVSPLDSEEFTDQSEHQLNIVEFQSKFKELMPSKLRYTFARNEL